MILIENKARQIFKPGQLIKIQDPACKKSFVDGYQMLNLQFDIEDKVAKRISVEENTSALYITCETISEQGELYSCELHKVLIGKEMFWFFDEFLKREL